MGGVRCGPRSLIQATAALVPLAFSIRTCGFGRKWAAGRRVWRPVSDPCAAGPIRGTARRSQVEVSRAPDLPVVRRDAIGVGLEQRATTHFPGHDRAVDIAPEDIVGVAAVEVAGAFDLP